MQLVSISYTNLKIITSDSVIFTTQFVVKFGNLVVLREWQRGACLACCGQDGVIQTPVLEIVLRSRDGERKF